MDITLRGLLPDRNYLIQARATAGVETSDWSQSFQFRTGKDDVAPRAPSNLAVKTEGRDFLISWTKPTHNEDNTEPVRDLKGYELTIYPTATPATKYVIFIPGEKWQFEYWENFLNFNGYKNNLTLEVRSVDLSGNKSATPATLNATKPLPAAPTLTSWAPKGDSFVATWTAPANVDVFDYEITITSPSQAGKSRKFYTSALTFELTRNDNAATFGIYTHTVDISVKTRDSAMQLSATGATGSATKAKPVAPTGLVFAAVGNAFQASWNAVETTTDGGILTDRLGYQVRLVSVVNAVTTERVFFTTGTTFSLSYEENKSNFGTPRSAFTIYVGTRDTVNQIGAEATATATNAKPTAPTNLTGTAVTEGVRLDWTASTSDDVAGYRVRVGATLTDAGTISAEVPRGSTSYVHQSVAYNSDIYLWLTTIDEFNTESDPTGRVGPFRPKSPFTVDQTPPPVTTVSGAAPAGRAATLPAAIQVSWPAVSATDLAGYHVRFSENVTPRVWEFVDVFDKTATTHLVTNLRSSTPYVFQIRSYDTMINPSDWSAESAAVTSSYSEVVLPPSLSGSLTIQTGGNIKSADYTIGGTAGWSLSSSTLDIQQGTVNARVVKAGVLVSTQNVTHDGTTQPAWSLNLAGNMSVNDAQVRGKIVVGNSAATNNANVNIASWNYGAAGQTGPQWAIRGDGTFDIKSGTGTRIQLSSAGLEGWNGTTRNFFLNASTGSAYFNGEIQAASGAINGSLNVSGRLEVYGGDAYVIARRSGTGAWVMLDGRSGTDWAIDSSTGRFRVDYDGNLTANNVNLTGTITSGSGTIGGWTINSTSLTASGVTIGNNGWFSGAVFSGGEVRANTVRSSNAPGSARSWCLQNDIAYRVWNINGTQTVYIDMDGNATFSNLTVNNGTFSGTVNASGGTFSGQINGGTFQGSRFNTSGNAGRVEIGNNVSYYGGSGDAIAFGGDSLFIHKSGSALRIGGYSGSALTFHYVDPLNYRFYWDVAGPDTGYGLSRIMTVSDQGITVDRKFQLNQKVMYLSGQNDGNHYIRYEGGYDGPRIHGYSNVSITTNWGRVAYADSAGAWRMNAMYVGGTGPKSFVIDHPTKPDKYLVHAAMESPTADVSYRGKAQLVDGVGHVELPEYFEQLTVPGSATAHVTPIVGCDNPTCDFPWSPTLAVLPIKGRRLTVVPQGGFIHPCATFYWEVKAIRADIEQFEVEPSKSDYVLNGQGPYTYLTKK